MGSSTPGGPVVPYDPNANEEAWKNTVKSWKWEVVNTEPQFITKRIEEDCPRCRHKLYKEITVYMGLAFRFPSRSQVSVKCNCSVPHPPKQAGEGCGLSVDIAI